MPERGALPDVECRGGLVARRKPAAVTNHPLVVDDAVLKSVGGHPRVYEVVESAAVVAPMGLVIGLEGIGPLVPSRYSGS